MYLPWRDSAPRARDAFRRAAVLTGAFAAVLLVLLFRFKDDVATVTISTVAVLVVGGGAGYFWVRFFRLRSGKTG